MMRVLSRLDDWLPGDDCFSVHLNLAELGSCPLQFPPGEIAGLTVSGAKIGQL